MQTYQIPNLSSGDQYVLESITQENTSSMQTTLDSIEARIAERKLMEYRNIQELERSRQKLESSVNTFQCFSYNPNPKMLQTKSRLEAEMIKLDMKRGEEAVSAFRDVERLETEKRKILDDLRDEKSMNFYSGGFT